MLTITNELIIHAIQQAKVWQKRNFDQSGDWPTMYGKWGPDGYLTLTHSYWVEYPGSYHFKIIPSGKFVWINVPVPRGK